MPNSATKIGPAMKEEYNLFIPFVDVITNHVHHHRAFWGIRFPIQSSSLYEPAIDIVKKYLEGSRNTVLEIAEQGFDLAAIRYAVIVKMDRKFIKHKTVFCTSYN